MFKDPAERYFDDFSMGDSVKTRGRTVDIGDITNFACLTGDYYPLHMDAEYMRGTKFGQRIAHGPFTFSLAVGLVGLSGFYGDAIVALIEIKTLKATKPVFAGDTVHVVAEVFQADATGAKYGTLGVNYSVRNQRDEEVMAFQQVMLARRKTKEG